MLCYRTLLEKSRGVPRRRARWQASKTSADFYRPARRSDPLTMNFRNGCSHAVGWRFNVGNLEIRINFRQWTAQMVHFRKMTRIRVIIRHPMSLRHPLGLEAGITGRCSEASTHSQRSIPGNARMKFCLVYYTMKMRAPLSLSLSLSLVLSSGCPSDAGRK